MNKYPVRMLLFGLFLGMLGYCSAGNYGGSLMDSISNVSFVPQMKEKWNDFTSYFYSERPMSPEYGNLQMMKSMNHKLWPTQRRKLNHKMLDKIEERFEAFPSPEEKRAKIMQINERLKKLERKCYG